jgi:hypothetical protein
MYVDVLRAIAGIDVFPVFSLVLFVTFFSIVLIRTWRLDRRELISRAAIPLDGTREAEIASAEARRQSTRPPSISRNRS